MPNAPFPLRPRIGQRLLHARRVKANTAARTRSRASTAPGVSNPNMAPSPFAHYAPSAVTQPCGDQLWRLYEDYLLALDDEALACGGLTPPPSDYWGSSPRSYADSREQWESDREWERSPRSPPGSPPDALGDLEDHVTSTTPGTHNISMDGRPVAHPSLFFPPRLRGDRRDASVPARRAGAVDGGQLLAPRVQHLPVGASYAPQARGGLRALVPRGLRLRGAGQAELLLRVRPFAPRVSRPREPHLSHAGGGHVAPGPAPDLLHPPVHVRASV